MTSSSLRIDNSEHDVFLSFRGEDTRFNFTSHFYQDLVRSNINVFIDRMLDKGEVLTSALYRAIETAKISVVIFSSGYASSSFCLDELVKILDCKHSKDQIVMPIFYKVDPAHLRKLQGTFEEAFAKHDVAFKGKNTSCAETSEQEMKVSRWKEALEEAANLTGWHVTNTCNEAEVIRRITQHVLMKLNWEPNCQSEGLESMNIQLVGEFTVNLKKIWKLLMDDNISRVGICGMGGVGKTTILTHINDRLIRDGNAFRLVYWVTMSKESSIYKLQNDIAEQIKLDLSREEDESKRASKLWRALNKKKKFVLIIDEMWESFELQEVGIPSLVDGRKLLLATRNHRVCEKMMCQGIVKIGPLLQREATNLFIRECEHQIDDNSELKNIVESVVKECRGLPLTVVVIARRTRGFSEMYEWRKILQELRKHSDRRNHDTEEIIFKPPKEDEARSSKSSSPDSTGSIRTLISSHFGGMRYPSLFSSKPTTIKEEPPSYESSVMQNYDFEILVAGSESQNEDRASSRSSQTGTGLFDYTAGEDDEISIKAGEEFEIDYEVDGWYYVRKKRPGSDGKMAGLVPVLYVNQL